MFQISAHFLPGNHLSKPMMSRFSLLQVRAESTKMEEFYPIKHPASDESRNGCRKNCGGGGGGVGGRRVVGSTFHFKLCTA